MIRGKINSCPFGLPVTEACSVIGGRTIDDESVILEMNSVEGLELSDEELERIVDGNMELMLSVDSPKQCPFADRIFPKKEAVDCKYDEESGVIPAGSAGLNGSPLYPHIMVGNMPKAQYGYPLDQYSDDNESRNIYYGIYSLIG